MEIISSTSNALVKRINKLKIKKYRDEYGEFFAEGYKNVLDSIAARRDLLKSVVLSERAYSEFGKDFLECPTTVVADHVYEKITDTDGAQGVLAVFDKPKNGAPSGENAEKLVLLDRVRDPGNVGTILRTCCAFGYGAVLNGCCDPFSPKAVRSAMSASLKCDIYIDVDIDALISGGYTLIAADMSGERLDVAKKPSGKFCIAVGNEADGISDEVMEKCARTVRIPQKNIESLNASVAAAVIMYAFGASE